MSDSVWPHRWQPSRLPHSWDSPGKNTGVGCHFLLHCMKVKSESEVAQSCPTLSDPMDCGLPGSSVHGIFQVRVLDWVASAFSSIHIQLGQIMDNNIQRDQKSNCHFWRPGAKQGYFACLLHTTPTKGWANHLSSPSGLTLDTALHSPHIRNQLSSLEQARETAAFYHSPLLLQGLQ